MVVLARKLAEVDERLVSGCNRAELHPLAHKLEERVNHARAERRDEDVREEREGHLEGVMLYALYFKRGDEDVREEREGHLEGATSMSLYFIPLASRDTWKVQRM